MATMSLPKSWMSFFTVPEHQGAVATLHGVLEFFLQGGAGLLEDVGGVDELGEVVLAFFEALSHDAHAGLQFFQDGEGGLACGQLVLDQGYRLVFFEVAHGLGERGRGHKPSLPFCPGVFA